MKCTKELAVAVSVLFFVSTTAVLAEDTGIVVRENGINRGSIYWWDDDSLLVTGVHSEHPTKDVSGGCGNDTITGNGGGNTYLYSLCEGTDTIAETNVADCIKGGAGDGGCIPLHRRSNTNKLTWRMAA